jgi:glycosyltransferase involved in cell wall biosynthesis
VSSVAESGNPNRYDITVVTPSFNQGRYIEQCISSVLEQRDVSVQYIVVDAESEDETSDVIERYAERIQEIIREPDNGQADALAKGFARAEADLVCYLNSDDYFLPGALSRAVRYLKNAVNVDAIYSHRTYVSGEDRFLRYWALPAHSDYINLRWDFIPQETCVWRRSAMEEVGGIDSTFQFAMDYDLFARMMKAGKKFKRVSEFFAVFREHDDSKTTRLMETLGATEVRRVRSQLAISQNRRDRYVVSAFFAVLQFQSRLLLGRYPNGPPGFGDRCRPQMLG